MYYNEELVHKFKFQRNYLENYNDSGHAVKTKNASFFMNFPNINKMATFSVRLGPLREIPFLKGLLQK